MEDAPAFILYPGAAGAPGTHLRAQTHAQARGASIRAIPVHVPTLLAQIAVGERATIAGIA